MTLFIDQSMTSRCVYHYELFVSQFKTIIGLPLHFFPEGKNTSKVKTVDSDRLPVEFDWYRRMNCFPADTL